MDRWLVLILAEVVLGVIASAAGASGGGGTSGLLLSLGLRRAAEAAVVAPRALATGVPFATLEDDHSQHARR